MMKILKWYGFKNFKIYMPPFIFIKFHKRDKKVKPVHDSYARPTDCKPTLQPIELRGMLPNKVQSTNNTY